MHDQFSLQATANQQGENRSAVVGKPVLLITCTTFCVDMGR
jgi:hypothetical protein